MRADRRRLTTHALAWVLVAMSALTSVEARADDWGCEVLLCLANPKGPMAADACVPPIKKLWTALLRGRPFPVCNFVSGLMSDFNTPDPQEQLRSAMSQLNPGAGSSARNVWAGAGYCREDLLYWTQGEPPTLQCNASGAIDVTVDGKLFTRVWWGVGDGLTLTEDWSQGSGQVPYDPTQAAALFIQREQQGQQDAPGANRGD